MSIFLPESHYGRRGAFQCALEGIFPPERDWRDSFQYFSSNPYVLKAVKRNYSDQRFDALQNSRLKRIFYILISFLVVIGLLSVCALVVFFTSQVASFSFSISLILSLGIPMVLALGGLGVLIKISHTKDVFTGKKVGFCPQRSIIPVVLGRALLSKKQFDYIRSEDSGKGSVVTYPILKLYNMTAYLDLSALDDEFSGIAPCYFHTPEPFVIPTALFFAPFFCLGIMCYNLLRTVIVIFYILYRILIYERHNPLYTDSSKKFRFSDIPREVVRSLFNVVKAPFYTLGLIIALGYSLIEPISGRILVGALERDWNHNVLLDYGTVNINPQSLWKFEGGGERLNLGNNATYLLGCCQPRSLFLLKKGKVISGDRSTLIVKDQSDNVEEKSHIYFSYPMIVPISELSQGTFPTRT